MISLRHSFLTATLLSAALMSCVIEAAETEGVRITPFHGYASAVEMTNGRVKVVLCPEVGGRVLEYSLNGRNSLYLSDGEKDWKPGDPPQSSAGRFDIGPELVIPQRDIHWKGAWQTEIIGPRHVRLTSPDDASTGTRLVRDFQLDAKTSKFLCTQTIHNISLETKEWCHWSRTFAVNRGICVIPLTQPSRFPNSYVLYEEGSLINMQPEDPMIQVHDEAVVILGAPRKPKLGFDSYAGVIAYLAPNDLLFVKRFNTFPDRVYNEAAGLTISVWYPKGDMIELEPIGPRERLAPGESAGFTEEWWLDEMPYPNQGQPDLKAVNSAVEKMQ